MIKDERKKIHRMYEEYKEMFKHPVSMMDEVLDYPEGEERDFYVAMINFFMHQKQQIGRAHV